ncbi:hypothetical protein IWQ47_004141 [Aquimarina sp. EL_43]|nr:hypothetical protein [Aquimarina sp. EL_35]MBG6152216.1 hypothetical protein [Aquimarina sp. EL_32]MBG6171054.1 hypothetical protein [Aquimarina sp. EL_43]
MCLNYHIYLGLEAAVAASIVLFSCKITLFITTKGL